MRRLILVLLLVSTLPAAAVAAVDPSTPGLAWGACPEFMPQGCRLAVLHGDPAKPNADVFLQVPAGSKIPRHWHTSAERIVMVSGEMEVRYDGQDPFVLRQGSYTHGPAKVPHEATCRKGAICTLFIAFEEPVDAVAAPAP
jgi:quercetin dioxygenase-like cupin family protein